jgi:Rod binding domain-containing protein
VIHSVSAAGMTGTGAAGGPDPRLKPAAHEFEACLMKEFLEPLQKDALFSQDGDGSSEEGSDSALMSFGAESMARAISERGGFGIATKIIEHFEGGTGGKTGTGKNFEGQI